jgi:hypothetical protein
VTVLGALPANLDPVTAAPRLANLGFLSSSDFPDRPGPAYLLVALREFPTLRHFDPESIEYWASVGGRGAHRQVTRHSSFPIDDEYSWGRIRIVDRLGVTNEYLTFGGRLRAAVVDNVVVAVFSSPAPILRRGGHSQGWDEGAESLGAFFGRVLLAVDYAPGFEARAATSNPIARYAAFVADLVSRYRAGTELRAQQPVLWTLIQAEEHRLRQGHPLEWAAGAALQSELAIGGGAAG